MLMTHRFTLNYHNRIHINRYPVLVTVSLTFRYGLNQVNLKLNSDKTEFIIIGTKQQRHKLSNHFPVKLLENDITPSDSVRNLGVIFDSDFSFQKHCYASNAFTTYVISAEFSVTYLYPLLRQYPML